MASVFRKAIRVLPNRIYDPVWFYSDNNRDHVDVGGNRDHDHVDGNRSRDHVHVDDNRNRGHGDNTYGRRDHDDDTHGHRDHGDGTYDHHASHEALGIFAQSIPCSQSSHGYMENCELRGNHRAVP